jgi:hypothetical protein
MVAENRAQRMGRGYVKEVHSSSGSAGTVHCYMHWRADTLAGAVNPDGCSGMHECTLVVLTEDCWNNTCERDLLKRALAQITRQWKAEFGIVLSADYAHAPAAASSTRSTSTLPRYRMTIPELASDGDTTAAQGVLFLMIHLQPITSTRLPALERAVVCAIGVAVAELAARDCVFITKQRQRRRRHASGIALRLSRYVFRSLST